MNPSFLEYRRKSLRADWYEYEEGIYFITICSRGGRFDLGYITDSCMKLSSIGKIVDEELRGEVKPHADFEIPLFVVMPNHIHFIINVKSG